MTLAFLDNAIYSNSPNLTIMVRSFDSLNFTRFNFPTTKSLLVPDMAFMLGNIKPLKSPIVDILVLRRTDNERRFDLKMWDTLLNEVVGAKYSFLVMNIICKLSIIYIFQLIEIICYIYMPCKTRDWFDYNDVKYTTFQELSSKRFVLVNEIISQARLIVTDRLHVSIVSLLMGKPHVIINEKYNKILHTRETAFFGKPECDRNFIQGYYTNDIREALEMAVFLLDQGKKVR
jgi:exopolysaccharide biosynthesis predicted pyruvyltransferase EpsI